MFSQVQEGKEGKVCGGTNCTGSLFSLAYICGLRLLSFESRVDSTNIITKVNICVMEKGVKAKFTFHTWLGPLRRAWQPAGLVQIPMIFSY